jgi:uncharacterized protein YjcR
VSAEYLLNALIGYYSLKNMSELANKLTISQSVISNWKSRNAVGAIVEKINEVDPEALSFIFLEKKTQINNLQNSTNNVAQNFGNRNAISSNQSNECIEISKMDKAIVQSFIDAYHILDKESRLKELYDTLGNFKWK